MKRAILLSSIILGAAGCATTAEKNVENAAHAQVGTESPTHAAASGRQAIMHSDKLTSEQKTKFLDLMDKTQAETKWIKEQEGRLKAALFEDLTAGKYEAKEISAYKSKLKGLEQKKLDLMFSSLDKVRSILGKDEVDPNLFNYYRESLMTQ
ncbi:MAG: hypothetical protein AB7F86_15275 [Bdellovibrionales bacterium]